MEYVQDLLLRIAELARPLAHQCGLNGSLRRDDIVHSLEQQKAQLEMQLIDAACREATNVLQRHKPSWSAQCLWMKPRSLDVGAALRLVKLAEITLMSPSVVLHYDALRNRLPKEPCDDRGVLALRLRLVWREVVAAAVSAAVHHGRSNKARLALGYSQRAIDLLTWVVMGLDGSGGAPLSDKCLRALLQACFDEDQIKSSAVDHGTAVPMLSSPTCERLVGCLSSHSVLLRCCDKFAEAMVFASLAVTAADGMLDAVALRGTVTGQSPDGAITSAKFLLALALYNHALAMEAVVAVAPCKSVSMPQPLKRLCDTVERYRVLRRCRELLTVVCGRLEGAHAEELLDVVCGRLAELQHSHAPLPSEQRRVSRARRILETTISDANDTLHYFQSIAGRLSQEKHRSPPWNHPPAGGRWDAVDPHASSLLLLA